MKTAVIVFPGSNCDRDMQVALREMTGQEPAMVWHADSQLPKVDLVALPGGFSYGDYLRCGAMAGNAPIIQQVKKHAEDGRLVLGVCNGFQVLTETRLLPGALMRNKSLKFICKPVELETANDNSVFTKNAGERLTIPIAHGEGNYFVDADGLKRLQDNDQIAFRYVEEINGATDRIAGVLNEAGNVLGMMPHPERAVDPLTGGLSRNTDGRKIFESFLR